MSAEPMTLRHLTVTPELARRREWLVTNGLGGYASGTLGMIPARRYHGLLIASLPNPAGRVMMLNTLAESLVLADHSRADVGWVAPEFETGKDLTLTDFTLELGLPVWRYAAQGIVLEKRLAMAYGLNTTVISYKLIEGGPLTLELRPALQFRGHDDMVSVRVPDAYPLRAFGAQIELEAPDPLPSLRFKCDAPRSTFVIDPRSVPELAYPTEESRGYDSRGKLYSPGRFRIELNTGETVSLFASTESWETIKVLGADDIFAGEHERRERLLLSAPEKARSGPAAELVLAADQFVIRPVGRREDHVRARVTGDEAWSVIAGYHWFTDWGRDTMISLEGLTLATGRHEQAGAILRMFAHHVRDGLVPNMFPEGANEGLYHTADATLWFFHAIDRYVRTTGDRRTLEKLLPVLRDIIAHHIRGTRFGIHVDPADGLLAEGAPGYQLTWMDAKAGDWVVTPRRGKPVEINALWYNALKLMISWDSEASGLVPLAAQCAASFEKRFWMPDKGYLFDVVDGEHGDDDACRPNQLFAISLPNPVLAREHWESVLRVSERELLTPVGLRSLSPRSPDYKPTYRGDLLTRDGAYHQGTVWSWLIGPYIDARLKTRPDDIAGARAALEGLVENLDANCIGEISEVFDAEPPFLPGGCIAQAWGVAETLRCLLLTT